MLTIASAQTKPADEDIDHNIRGHIALIELAAENGAGLVAFPEMSLTGYLRESAKDFCFTEDDARLNTLRDSAAANNIIIIAGAPAVIGSNLYIGSFIMFPDRSVRIYTKQFLHTGEEQFFSPGFDHNITVELNGERICPAICADIDNPLHVHNASVNRCTVYTASIFFRNALNAHEPLQAYSKKYSMAVLMSNFYGTSYGLVAGGRSAMWSENGDIIAELGEADTGLVLGTKYDSRWSGSVIKT